MLSLSWWTVRLIALSLLASVLPHTGAQAQTPKPPANAIVELSERLRLTLQRSVQEAEQERTRIKTEVVGQPQEWTLLPGGTVAASMPTRVGAEAGTYEAPSSLAVRKDLQNLDQRLADWRAKKSPDDIMVLGLYSSAIAACIDGYHCLERGVQLDLAVLSASALHEDDLLLERARNTGVTTGVDPGRAALWAKAVARARVIHRRLSEARKRWCTELWRYYEFAQAQGQLTKGPHAGSANDIKNQIDSVFGSQSRPIKTAAVVPGTPWGLVSLRSLSNHYLNGQPGEWVGSNAAPELQVFEGIPTRLAVGLCLEPSVEALRVAKEAEAPLAITDTIVLPEVNSRNGLALPTFNQGRPVNNQRVYTLFLYGPKLPVRAAELKSLQSGDTRITLRPLGFLEDLQKGRQNTQVRRLFELGQDLVAKNMKPVDAKNFLDMPAILVEVQVPAGIVPGYKPYRLNGVAGGWFLPQGTGVANLQLVTELLGDERNKTSRQSRETEPTEVVSVEQSFLLEVQTNPPSELPAISLVLGRGRSFAEFDGEPRVWAFPDSQKPGLFRTLPIRIVAPGDARLDAQEGKASRERETLYLAGTPGQRLDASLEDSHWFLTAHPVVSAQVSPAVERSLWLDALRRAATADGKQEGIVNWDTIANSEATTISNTILTQVIFKSRLQYVAALPYTLFIQRLYNAPLSKGDIVVSNKITVGNHAAMLLMRDHFIRLMSELADSLDAVKTPSEQLDFMKALAPMMVPNSGNNNLLGEKQRRFPIGEILVTSVNAPSWQGVVYTTNHPLWRFYYPTWIPKGNATVVAQQGLLDGFQLYRKSVQDALDRARSLKDGDIEGLLALTGNGFNEVVKDLKPLLWRRVPLPSGEGYRWEQDFRARAEVNGVNAAYEAVRAQKDYSALDTQVVLAMASLTPMVFSSGVVHRIATVAVNATMGIETLVQTLPEAQRQEEEYRFALGASSVLGGDRFYMADLQRAPSWTIVLGAVTGGVSGLSAAHELFTVMGRLTKGAAFPLARAVAARIKARGVAALATATPQEQAAFFAASGGVELKQAAEGVAALTAEETTVKEAFKTVAAEVKTKSFKTQILPEKEIFADKVQIKLVDIEPTTPVLPEPFPPTKPLSSAPTRPLPEGAPKVDIFEVPPPMPPKGVWQAPNSKTFVYDKLLSWNTLSFIVLKDAAVSRVVKICKMIGEDGLETWNSVKKASETLVRKKIPHMKLREVFTNETQRYRFGYLTQDFLPTSFVAEQESFIVSDYLKRSVSLPNGKKSFYKLTEDMEDAIIGLLQRFKEEKVVWEDFKLDNIYLRRVKAGMTLTDGSVVPKGSKLIGTWECGVIDIDRVAEWGDFGNTLDYFAGLLEGDPTKMGVKSVIGDARVSADALMDRGLHPLHSRLITSAEQFWELVLEGRQIVHFEEGIGFMQGRLSLEKLRKVFPGLKRTTKFDFRKVPGTRPLRRA